MYEPQNDSERMSALSIYGYEVIKTGNYFHMYSRADESKVDLASKNMTMAISEAWELAKQKKGKP